ncbi:hypothetical protein CHUAL_002146 [Chamberlinius hualienensis]
MMLKAPPFTLIVICTYFGTLLALPTATTVDQISSTVNVTPSTTEIEQTSSIFDLTPSTIEIEQTNVTETPNVTETVVKQSRQGRIMNIEFPEDSNNITETFKDDKTSDGDGLNGIESLSKSGSAASPLKTYRPSSIYSSSSVSYSNPIDTSGISGLQPSDLIPYYYDHHDKRGNQRNPVMYQLSTKRPSFSFHDAIKDTLFRFKDSVTHGVSKFKNAIGLNGFSEKISSPDTIMAVAPVAAGILAGGLAVAFLASKAHGARSNATKPFNIFGKRSIRDMLSEESLNMIVSRLDPVQREYLQKMQLYGPQRWKDTNCAKFILCDVMRKASPLHIFDMQRKVGVFLSRMDEATARYIEMILKDVMLGIQARDCSRFSCAHAPWGLPPQSPPVPIFPQQPLPHFQPFNGHNFLRRRQQ